MQDATFIVYWISRSNSPFLDFLLYSIQRPFLHQYYTLLITELDNIFSFLKDESILAAFLAQDFPCYSCSSSSGWTLKVKFSSEKKYSDTVFIETMGHFYIKVGSTTITVTVGLLAQEHDETLHLFVSICMTFRNVGSQPFLINFTPRFLPFVSFLMLSAIISGVFSRIIASRCVLCLRSLLFSCVDFGTG